MVAAGRRIELQVVVELVELVVGLELPFVVVELLVGIELAVDVVFIVELVVGIELSFDVLLDQLVRWLLRLRAGAGSLFIELGRRSFVFEQPR